MTNDDEQLSPAGELRRCTDLAAATASAETLWLCEAFPAGKALRGVQALPVVTWAYFNPIGPSLCSCYLHPTNDGRDLLISVAVTHPFEPTMTVYGCIPFDIAGSSDDPLAATLERLFSNNGSTDFPILVSAPSSVVLEEGAIASPENAKNLFALALIGLPVGLQEASDLLQKHWCEPWERATEEWSSAISRFSAPFKAMREGRTADASSSMDRLTEEFRSVADGAAFERWWRLVTHPDHVAAERAALPEAWSGALAMAEGRSLPG